MVLWDIVKREERFFQGAVDLFGSIALQQNPQQLVVDAKGDSQIIGGEQIPSSSYEA